MTEKQLQFMIDVGQNLEFDYKGKKYTLRYDKDSEGNKVFYFGETFFEKKFESYGDLMNNAMVENSFFRNVVENL
ncbi:MAG: hypothetical protein KBT11_05980 [Treponema sp.]|nr:hypothetical protein [Candidatus Treponema equifaecale]